MTNLQITKIPLDAPGARIVGSIEGSDVGLYELRDILSGIEEDIARTDAALKVPELADLAVSVRSAHFAIQKIAFHLLELHDGAYRGTWNYTDDPIEVRATL